MTTEKQITFDLSGLIPEARNIASEVATIFWKHTNPGLSVWSVLARR
ncbi:MAG: hypothetical protein R2867_20725 [Caldilineaceae bacterium]